MRKANNFSTEKSFNYKKRENFMGFDVGTHRIGYGVIYWNKSGPKILKAGMIVKDKKFSFLNDFKKIEKLIKNVKPKLVVLEKIYFSRNVTNALSVAEVQGLIKYACEKSKVKFLEVHPKSLKLKISGDGNADKNDIKNSVNYLLKINKKFKTDDIYDALALALYGSMFI
jgi:crossover junction endodeoxyribonuclease RuvC